MVPGRQLSHYSEVAKPLPYPSAFQQSVVPHGHGAVPHQLALNPVLPIKTASTWLCEIARDVVHSVATVHASHLRLDHSAIPSVILSLIALVTTSVIGLARVAPRCRRPITSHDDPFPKHREPINFALREVPIRRRGWKPSYGFFVVLTVF